MQMYQNLYVEAQHDTKYHLISKVRKKSEANNRKKKKLVVDQQLLPINYWQDFEEKSSWKRSTSWLVTWASQLGQSLDSRDKFRQRATSQLGELDNRLIDICLEIDFSQDSYYFIHLIIYIWIIIKMNIVIKFRIKLDQAQLL